MRILHPVYTCTRMVFVVYMLFTTRNMFDIKKYRKYPHLLCTTIRNNVYAVHVARAYLMYSYVPYMPDCAGMAFFLKFVSRVYVLIHKYLSYEYMM